MDVTCRCFLPFSRTSYRSYLHRTKPLGFTRWMDINYNLFPPSLCWYSRQQQVISSRSIRRRRRRQQGEAAFSPFPRVRANRTCVSYIYEIYYGHPQHHAITFCLIAMKQCLLAIYTINGN